MNQVHTFPEINLARCHKTKQFKTTISKTKCYLWIGITYQEKKNQTDLRLLHTNHEYASHSAQPEQPSKVSLVDCTTFRHAHELNILQHLSSTSYFLLVSYQRLTNKGLFNENPAIRPSRRHGQFYMPWSINESVDSIVHYFKTSDDRLSEASFHFYLNYALLNVWLNCRRLEGGFFKRRLIFGP